MISFKQTLEKLESSQEFQKFKQEHEDAKLCAGFFVIDFENQQNQQQLDYCLTNEDIFTFNLNNEIILEKAKTFPGAKKLQPIEREIKTDLEQVESLINQRLQQEKINKKIQKIIAILQLHENKLIWNITCMLEGMEIIMIHIGSQSGEFLKFEKKSLFDIIKKQ